MIVNDIYRRSKEHGKEGTNSLHNSLERDRHEKEFGHGIKPSNGDSIIDNGFSVTSDKL